MHTLAYIVTILGLLKFCSGNDGFCEETRQTARYDISYPKSYKEYEELKKVFNCESIQQKCVSPELFVLHFAITPWRNETVAVCAPKKEKILGRCLEYNYKGGQVQENWNANCMIFPYHKCPFPYPSNEAYKYFLCFEKYGRQDICLREEHRSEIDADTKCDLLELEKIKTENDHLKTKNHELLREIDKLTKQIKNLNCDTRNCTVKHMEDSGESYNWYMIVGGLVLTIYVMIVCGLLLWKYCSKRILTFFNVCFDTQIVKPDENKKMLGDPLREEEGNRYDMDSAHDHKSTIVESSNENDADTVVEMEETTYLDVHEPKPQTDKSKEEVPQIHSEEDVIEEVRETTCNPVDESPTSVQGNSESQNEDEIEEEIENKDEIELATIVDQDKDQRYGYDELGVQCFHSV